MDIIYSVLAGSRMYGAFNDESDFDHRNVFLPRYDDYFGFSKTNVVKTGEGDTVNHSIQKFIQLYLTCSPNIIELLYAPADNILKQDGAGQRLVSMRFKLLSKRNIRNRFFGFSMSELTKYIADPTKVKCGANAIRLMYEAIELLEHGRLTFPRPEVKLLNSIRHNETPFTYITFLHKHLQYILEQAYINCAFLPENPDNEYAERSMIELIKKFSWR